MTQRVKIAQCNNGLNLFEVFSTHGTDELNGFTGNAVNNTSHVSSQFTLRNH